MSLDLIVRKLSKLGLIDSEGEGIQAVPFGLLVFFTDGSSGFYADPREALNGLKSLDSCTPEQFWDRSWLDAPTYESLLEVWESLDTPQIEAAQKPPRSSDFISVGRLKRFGPGYLIQTDDGDYGVVDEKQASKWRLTPVD